MIAAVPGAVVPRAQWWFYNAGIKAQWFNCSHFKVMAQKILIKKVDKMNKMEVERSIS